MNVDIKPLGDTAVVIQLGTKITPDTHRRVGQVVSLLEKHNWDWLAEIVPSFAAVTVYYQPEVVFEKQQTKPPYQYVMESLRTLISQQESETMTVPGSEQALIEIPVCYGGDYGPDLEKVAAHNNLSTEEVIKIHSSEEYLVYMIGFAPGFPYLGGMSKSIATPRRDEPRKQIPAGSVGIAGQQTGVYPLATPGGWQLIGQTPKQLFDPERNPPSLLSAGDRIKFIPIDEADFTQKKEGES